MTLQPTDLNPDRFRSPPAPPSPKPGRHLSRHPPPIPTAPPSTGRHPRILLILLDNALKHMPAGAPSSCPHPRRRLHHAGRGRHWRRHPRRRSAPHLRALLPRRPRSRQRLRLRTRPLHRPGHRPGPPHCHHRHQHRRRRLPLFPHFEILTLSRNLQVPLLSSVHEPNLHRHRRPRDSRRRRKPEIERSARRRAKDRPGADQGAEIQEHLKGNQGRYAVRNRNHVTASTAISTWTPKPGRRGRGNFLDAIPAPPKRPSKRKWRAASYVVENRNQRRRHPHEASFTPKPQEIFRPREARRHRNQRLMQPSASVFLGNLGVLAGAEILFPPRPLSPPPKPSASAPPARRLPRIISRPKMRAATSPPRSTPSPPSPAQGIQTQPALPCAAASAPA